MPLFYVPGLLQVSGGLLWGLGNRDTPLDERPLWAARAQRAHANMVENLAPFAALVLIAHAAGLANAATATGATMFFWGRVAHFAIYTAGIPYVRTLAFGIAIAGEIRIFLALFG